jgi:thiamine biosynthesis lipoprotein
LNLLRKCILLFITFGLICCAGCSLDSRYESEFFAMDTIMTMTAYGSNAAQAVKSAESEINRLDALLSVQNESSEIYKLNQQKSLDVSSDALSLINTSLEISAMTDGAFDITSEPLSRAWGFYSGLENRVPTQDEIDALLSCVGAEHITLENSKVSLDENTSIDLGGIAKGYAAARVAQIFAENNVTSALVSLGGNVRAVGSKPDGSDWSVAITDPDDNSNQLGVLSVSNRAVVTSGGYQRYFEENGQIYHHIIDTATGYPACSGLKSVTIVSEDDTLADGLSTALFVMGLERSADLYSQNSSLFGAVLVTDSNEIYVTDNLKDTFSSERSFEVINS